MIPGGIYWPAGSHIGAGEEPSGSRRGAFWEPTGIHLGADGEPFRSRRGTIWEPTAVIVNQVCEKRGCRRLDIKTKKANTVYSTAFAFTILIELC